MSKKEQEAKVEETKADEVKTKKTKVVKEKADEVKTEKTKANKTKGEEPKADEVKVEKAKTDKAKVEKAKTDKAKDEKVKAEESKTDEVKTKKAKTKKTKVEKAETNKVKTEKAKDEAKTEESKVDEAKTKKAKADEVKVDKVKDEKAKTEEPKVDKVETDNIKINEFKADNFKVDDFKPVEVKVEKVEDKETKDEKVKDEKAKVDETKTEKTKVDEAKANETKTKEVKDEKVEGKTTKDEAKADEVKAEKVKANKTSNKFKQKVDNSLTYIKNHPKKSAVAVVAALTLFCGGYLVGNHYSGLNKTIATATINGKTTKVKVGDVYNVSKETDQVKAAANQALSYQVLSNLYPKQTKQYEKDAQMYIKKQIKQYGGEAQYKTALAQSGSSEVQVKKDYVLTQLVGHSVRYHNPLNQKKLKQLYNKTAKESYYLTGYLVRNKKEAKKLYQDVNSGKSFDEAAKSIKETDKANFQSTKKAQNLTLSEISELDPNLASDVSKMKQGDVKIIKSSAGNYFVLRLNKVSKLSYDKMKNKVKANYYNEVMTSNKAIRKSLTADYKRAHVKIVDKEFSAIKDLSNFYSDNQLMQN